MKPAWTLAALVLIALLAAAPPATAGTADAPEVSDPAGDVAATRGPLVGLPPDPAPPLVAADPFQDVDVLAAWIQSSGAGFNVTILSAGPPGALTRMNVSFAIETGPSSLPSSVANGTVQTASATGTTVAAGPAGTTVTQSGNQTVFAFPFAGTGASAGDVVAGLVVAASRTNEGDAPVEEDDQSGTDLAPDSGTGADFTLPTAVVPGVTVTVTGGEVDDADGTRTFTGDLAQTTDDAAEARFTVEVENTGTGADAFVLSVGNAAQLAEDGITATIDPTDLPLAAGATGTATLTLRLDGTAVGAYAATVDVASTAGASGEASATVEVAQAGSTTSPAPTTTTAAPTSTPPPVDEDGKTDPVIGGPIQDAAEALGLDGPFDEWAGVVLLALALLLVLVLLFLLLFLGRKNWLIVRVLPRSGRAAPGEYAEYAIEVRNRKKKAFQTRLHFEAVDPTWKTGVLMTQADGATLDPLTQSDQELEFTLNGRKDPGSAYHGTLRVKVPETAPDGARNKVALIAVPLDDAGEEKRNKTRTAAVKVRSDLSVATPKPEISPNVRLSDVTHEPIDPAPGEQVQTTAKLENDDQDRTWVLRVVLNVDGQDLQQQVVAVPPRKARAVIFTWTASSEENHVRVLVYEKTAQD